jgi:hypothetical protein
MHKQSNVYLMGNCKSIILLGSISFVYRHPLEVISGLGGKWNYLNE